MNTFFTAEVEHLDSDAKWHAQADVTQGNSTGLIWLAVCPSLNPTTDLFPQKKGEKDLI